MTAINIDHKKGLITTDTDGILFLTEKGAVKIGSGLYLDELGNVNELEPKPEYIGAMRYNQELDILQVCDGLNWLNINGNYVQTSSTIWSLIF